MTDKNLPIIGILGGMGPLATADFFTKLIRNMNKNTDQEHNRIIMDSNSQIPDRVNAILKGSTDPTPELIKSAFLLENAGVSIIAVPCHTAFPFIEKMKDKIKIPIIDMVTTVIEEVVNQNLNKIGILQSKGLYKLKLYKKLFKKHLIETIELNENENLKHIEQVRVRTKENLIDDITFNHLQTAINILVERGAPQIALCCSELPLALKVPRENVIDSNDLFAKKVLDVLQDF